MTAAQTEFKRRLALLRKANNPEWLEAAVAGQPAGLTGIFLEHALEVQKKRYSGGRRREREPVRALARWEVRRLERQAHKESYRRYIYGGTPGLDGIRWAERRAERIRLDGGRCCRCGEQPKHLVVHHLHYETLKRERMKDLRTVCGPCHEEIHSDPEWSSNFDEWTEWIAESELGAGATKRPAPADPEVIPF